MYNSHTYTYTHAHTHIHTHTHTQIITLAKMLRLKFRFFFKLTHFQFKQTITMTLYVCLIQTDLNMQPWLWIIWQISWGLGSAGRLERLWPSPSRKLTQASLHGSLRAPSNKTASSNLPTLCHLFMGIMWLKKKSILKLLHHMLRARNFRLQIWK